LREKCHEFFLDLFRIFLFHALPSVGLCRVPDKQLSAKKPLPIGFLLRALYQKLRSAKALTKQPAPVVTRRKYPARTIFFMIA
jgi:hypothetical protein